VNCNTTHYRANSSSVPGDPTASLLANAQLVTKVYFPRLALPLSTILQQLVNLVVTLAVMGVLCAIYRVSPAGRVVLLPVWLAGILAFAIGLGLIFGALMVRYRDVRYVLPMLVQMLLYASPVGYTLAALQERVSPLLRRLYLLNPLAGLLEAVRWSLLPVGTLPVPAVTYALAASLVTLLAGVFFFVWAERRFADVI
jgi:ABC-type polysaccharide/polyol phosphate export systems, permease component